MRQGIGFSIPSNSRKGSPSRGTPWRQIVVSGHELADSPWGNRFFNATDSVIFDWSYLHRHYALMRLIYEYGGPSKSDKRRAMLGSSEEGDITLLNILLDGEIAHNDMGLACRLAAGGGHLEVVERLLAMGADVNDAAAADYRDRTALQAAAEGGHLEVVERLLAVGADVNDAAADGRTALQAAAKSGHTEIISRLEKAGAQPFVGKYRG